MENEEIIQLRELKEQLLKKGFKLKDKLKDQEDNGRQSLITLNITLPSDNEDHISSELLSIKHRAKLCEISSQVIGITFQDINKKWLQDDVYLYTAKAVTKTVSFNFDLTISLKDSGDFTIKDIVCYFIEVDDCYMLEISTWFQKIINTKNFSLLMSAISDYNEYSVLRSKILHSLESNKYVRTEQYTEENGGILVYMHSPTDTEETYVSFQWNLKFLELTWHIEHFFIVKSTDIGMRFSEENRILLKEFCKIGLTKDDLIKLWDRLCTAIDTYHEKTMEK